jgi:hypothetical protein
MLSQPQQNNILCSLILTTLIYEFGTTIKRRYNTGSISYTNPVFLKDVELTTHSKDLLQHIPDISSGMVTSFWNNRVSDLQAGITLSLSHRRITVVFRGSESLTDWLIDFRLCRTEAEYGYVHSGFHYQLHHGGVGGEILDEVCKLKNTYPSFSIFVTGHSLGGALATLFSYELSVRLPTDNIQLINFGSPRVGDAIFQKNFDSKVNLFCLRVTNHRDPITVLPIWGYTHVGQEVLLSRLPRCCIFCEDTLLKRYNPWDHLCETYHKRFLEYIELE